MKERGRDMAAGIASMLALVIVVGAPPWLLARLVGWPLPKALRLEDVRHALGGAAISDVFIVKALACACWVAWSLVVLAVVAEVVAWSRGRTAATVPFAGLLQPSIGRLVMSAAVVLSAMRPAALPVSPSFAVALAPASPPAPLSVRAAVDRQLPAAPDLPTCVVQRRDSLWRLAERHLGDGLRWREIFELNKGVRQPDGRALHEPGLIVPGWILRLPADAVHATLQVPEDPKPVASTPPTASASPATPPPVTAPPATPPAPAVAATTSTSAPMTPDTGSREVRDVADGESDRYAVPATLAGAVLLSAGVVATLNGFRRRQQRTRTPGHTIPMPDSEARAQEALLRQAAESEPASRLDLALRLIAPRLSQSADLRSTRIDAVRVEADEVEILLTQPLEVDAGPFDVVEGRSWTLGRTSAEDLAQARRTTSPAPALVTVGSDAGRQVLLDLEDSGLDLVGDQERAEGVLWSMALELATSLTADDVRVVIVGQPPEALRALDRVEVVDDMAEARAVVKGDNAAKKHAMVTSGWEARITTRGEAWPPIVVFVQPGLDLGDDGQDDLAIVAVRPRPTAGAQRWLIVSHDGRVRLDPLRVVLTAPGFGAQQLGPTLDLLACAASDEPGPPLVIETDSDASVPDVARPDTAEKRVIDDLPVPTPWERPDGVHVKVLGPVVVENSPYPVARRRVKELVVYLALHPRGCTEGEIKAALWPDDEPTTQAFNQTVSRARHALGEASDGEPLIAYVDNGIYRVHAELEVDASRVERALSLADNALLAVACEGLIRGEPFAASGAGWHWAYFEGIAYRLQAIVDMAQERLRSVVDVREISPTPPVEPPAQRRGAPA